MRTRPFVAGSVHRALHRHEKRCRGANSSAGASRCQTIQRMSSPAEEEGTTAAERKNPAVDRGDFLRTSVAVILAGGGLLATSPSDSAKAIGDLYEFKDQARFAQHATVQVRVHNQDGGTLVGLAVYRNGTLEDSLPCTRKATRLVSDPERCFSSAVFLSTLGSNLSRPLTCADARRHTFAALKSAVCNLHGKKRRPC